MLVEGWRCCREAARLCPEQILAVLVDEEQERDLDALNIPSTIPTFTASAKELQQCGTTEHQPGILFLMKRIVIREELPAQFTSWFLPVLDRVSDPGNLGTMLRTFWAVGIREAILLGTGCDPFNPKAIRAGMGAQFAIDFYTTGDVDALTKAYRNHKIWVTHPRRGANFAQPQCSIKDSLVVFGNEAHGVDPDWNLKVNVGAAEYLHIPMPGDAESLNVAQVATLLACVGYWRKANIEI